MARIVVVGSANVDLVARAAHIPRPGETVLGRDFATALGGKGANQAVAAARLGAEVTFVARIGTDGFGDQCLNGYEKDKVDAGYIVRDKHQPTGVALIAVADDGENSIIVASGANMALSPVDVAAADQAFRQASVLLLQLEISLDTVESAAKLAQGNGARVILNPAPAQPIPSKILQHVDVITPNRIELAQLLEMSEGIIMGMTDEQLAKAVLSLGPKEGVVTLGSEGALAAGPWGWRRVPSFEISAVDTTAAGDAFNGGLAVALAEGQGDLVAAVRFASACGAIAATRYGAQPSLPLLAEVEALMDAQSTRT